MFLECCPMQVGSFKSFLKYPPLMDIQYSTRAFMRYYGSKLIFDCMDVKKTMLSL